MRVPTWIQTTLDNLDAGDPEGFCEHIAENCTFIYANQDPVRGKDNIRDFVAGFLDNIEKTDHTVEQVFQAPGNTIITGNVEYTRHDGSTHEVPFADAFETGDDGIETYQVFIDISEL